MAASAGSLAQWFKQRRPKGTLAPSGVFSTEQ